jgi:WD40 repeat protein
MAVAYSPDGKLLAAAGADRMIQVWDIETNKKVGTLEGHAGAVNSVAWSPDGKQLASSSSDGMVKIWDIESASEIATLVEIKNESSTGQSHVSWSPDRNLIAIGGCCGALQLWDPTAGEVVAILEGHGGTTLDMAWSPDGSMLATANVDSSIQIWDTATGQRIALLLGHMGDTFRVSWSPDEQQVVSGGLDGTVRLWDVETGEELASFSEQGGTVSWSPDGQLIASSGYEVVLWEVESEEEVATIDVGGKAIWSPDGTMLAVEGDQLKILAVAEEGTEVRYVNVVPEKEADISGWSRVDYELPGGNGSGIRAIAVGPDGRVWFATQNDGVNVLENDTWVVYKTENSDLLGDYTTSVAFDADGRAWIGTREGVSVIDGENWINYTAENSGLPRTSFDPNGTETVLNITFDGKGSAWISTTDGGLTRFDGQEWTTYGFNGKEGTLFRNDSLDCPLGSVTSDRQGNIWVGTPGGGLFMFDGQEWQTVREDLVSPRETGECVGYYTTWIDSIAVDREDRIWIANGQEISSYNGESWTEYSEALPQGSREIDRLALAPDGAVWVLSSEGELYALEQDGTWIDYSLLRDTETINKTGVFVIDQENRLWFEDYYLQPPAQ